MIMIKKHNRTRKMSVAIFNAITVRTFMTNMTFVLLIRYRITHHCKLQLQEQ